MNRSGNTGLTARLLWKQRGRAFSFGGAAGVLRESWYLLLLSLRWFEPRSQTVLDKFA